MRWSALLLVACHSAPDVATQPPAVCPGAGAWGAGEPIFVDRTEAWGLTGVAGVRITAADFDGDGWADLHVAKATEAADDFSDGGARFSWLMRNVGGRFEDVTASSGFRAARRDPTHGRPGQVVAWGDVDNDGDLDAWTGVVDPTGALDETSELVLNRGDGTFELAPHSPLRLQDPDAPAGASFVDVDRDGLLDLWIAQGAVNGAPQQSHLWRGDGHGGFTRVTDDVGLTTEPWGNVARMNVALGHPNAWSGAACDLDDDGRPDLLASSYGRAPNLLWTQQADGTFANRSVLSGYAYDRHVDWTDNESARCWCKLHRDDEGCAAVPEPRAIGCESDDDAFRWYHPLDRQLYRLGGNSGTTVCADVDDDGDLDLLTTEIVHWDVGSSSDASELLINDGAGVFERPGAAVTGLTRAHATTDWNDGDITAAVLDVDNDAWPDVYVGSTDYPGDVGLLWRQVSPGRFASVPVDQGIDHHRSHGVAVADFDHDGDLDLVVGHSLGRCDADCYPTGDVHFYENQTGGTWVTLELVGGDANRAAIGARVRVTADGVTQTHEVGGGHGHYGMQDELAQHFGLGAACEAHVEVRWPDAALSVQRFDLAPGHAWRVEQGRAPEAIW
ncbi:MAG TPA: CRTAC1 family protein [Myxococcota bacterium]|nr:CRTAC1 family protein [Myxococcota bacterium]